MEKYLKTLKPLNEKEILNAPGDDITQRLVRLERKVDLLVDTLTDYEDYYNGVRVCGDMYNLSALVDRVYDFLKYGFPEAAKRAEENKKLMIGR